MALLAKAGIFGGLITSVVLPVAITSSTGTESVGLLDLESLDEIKKQAEPKNIPELFSSYGYRKKNDNELAALSNSRSTSVGMNFALGCHRLLFGRSDIRRLSDNNAHIRDGIWNGEPMGDYLDKDTRLTVLGCSTASAMKWGNEDVYEYELGVKRGDIGFLERITVWKNTNRAVSQLIVLKKATNPRTKGYAWFNWYGIQRIGTGTQGFVIGNPENGEWTDLNIGGEKDKPKYFAVWVSDPTETSSNKSMLKGLGIKTKPDQKLFSSVAKAENANDWHFNFFKSISDSNYFINISAHADSNKRYATYNSKVAAEVASFKGTWKNVKSFCQSQENRELEKLTYADVERLRDYCFTHRV